MSATGEGDGGHLLACSVVILCAVLTPIKQRALGNVQAALSLPLVATVPVILHGTWIGSTQRSDEWKVSDSFESRSLYTSLRSHTIYLLNTFNHLIETRCYLNHGKCLHLY